MKARNILLLLPFNHKGIFTAEQVESAFENIQEMADQGFNVPQPVSLYCKKTMERLDAFIVSKDEGQYWMRTPKAFMKVMDKDDELFLTSEAGSMKTFAAGVTSNLYKAGISFSMSSYLCVIDIPNDNPNRVTHDIIEVLLFKRRVG